VGRDLDKLFLCDGPGKGETKNIRSITQCNSCKTTAACSACVKSFGDDPANYCYADQ